MSSTAQSRLIRLCSEDGDDAPLTVEEWYDDEDEMDTLTCEVRVYMHNDRRACCRFYFKQMACMTREEQDGVPLWRLLLRNLVWDAEFQAIHRAVHCVALVRHANVVLEPEGLPRMIPRIGKARVPVKHMDAPNCIKHDANRQSLRVELIDYYGNVVTEWDDTLERDDVLYGNMSVRLRIPHRLRPYCAYQHERLTEVRMHWPKGARQRFPKARQITSIHYAFIPNIHAK